MRTHHALPCLPWVTHSKLPFLPLLLQECKISGEIGFSDEFSMGGAPKNIPLTDIEIDYQFKKK